MARDDNLESGSSRLRSVTGDPDVTGDPETTGDRDAAAGADAAADPDAAAGPDAAWRGAVRHSLRSQAPDRPPQADLTSVVLRRARRVRRRRTIAGLAAVTLATGAAAGAVHQLWEADDPQQYAAVTRWLDNADPPSSVARDRQPRLAADPHLARTLDVDVVGPGAGDRMVLATADGDAYPLARVRDDVHAVQRVRDGWLVVSGAPDRQRLTWHPAAPKEEAGATDGAGATGDGTAGEVRTLLAGVDRIAVGGQRVVWQRGRTLAAADLQDGTLTGRILTTGPADGEMAAVADGRALLRRDAAPAGDDSVAWDYWSPEEGDYQPAWRSEVVRLFGDSGDGSAVGLVADPADAGRSCLVRLRLTRGMPVDDTRCLPADVPPLTGPAASGPAGQWLAVGAGDRAVLVDLTEVFRSGTGTGNGVTAVSDVPSVTTVSWPDPDRAVFTSDDTVVQIRPSELPAAPAGAGDGTGGVEAAVTRTPLDGPPPVVAAAS